MRRKGGPVVAGLLMQAELRFLGGALERPERPFVSILGGAKISGKIDVIEHLLPRVDRLLIGGAMANTFFEAMGLETGASLVERDRVEMAAALLERAGEKLVLPVDCVIAEEAVAGAETRTVARDAVPAGWRILDIGPRSVAVFGDVVKDAGTVLWNGPMGLFEVAAFRSGTDGVAGTVADIDRRRYSVHHRRWRHGRGGDGGGAGRPHDSRIDGWRCGAGVPGRPHTARRDGPG
jgi:phosphoglycerate kinase